MTHLVSALLAGLITSCTAMMALLTKAASLAEIPDVAYAAVFVGGLLAAAKDYQSSKRDPDE